MNLAGPCIEIGERKKKTVILTYARKRDQPQPPLAPVAVNQEIAWISAISASDPESQLLMHIAMHIDNSGMEWPSTANSNKRLI